MGDLKTLLAHGLDSYPHALHGVCEMMPTTSVFQQAQSSPLIKPDFVQQLTSNQQALQRLNNVMLLRNVVILTVVDVP